MMKKQLYYIVMTVLITSCGQSKLQEEAYDFIATTTYNNSYDASGKLLSTYINETKEQNVNGKYIMTGVEHIVRKCIYPELGSCEVSETSNLFPQEVSVVITGQNSDQSYSIKNNTDTLYYTLSTYLNKNKSKPIYYRHIWNSVLNVDAKEDYELRYDYDNGGNNTRIEKRDFNTGEVSETYVFCNLSYEDATKLVSKKNNTRIACCFENKQGDTTIMHYQLDGKTTYYEKRYEIADKLIKEKLDINSRIIEKDINYKEHGFDISVKEIVDLSLVDSVYSIQGREVRKVSLYPDSKTIITSEYDDRGNIQKKVKKSTVTVTEEDITNMLRAIQKV